MCARSVDEWQIASRSETIRRCPALKQRATKVFGQGLYDGAKEGQITEVSYMFPKPGTDTTPVAKISLVTKVGDLGCGVGYYK